MDHHRKTNHIWNVIHGFTTIPLTQKKTLEISEKKIPRKWEAFLVNWNLCKNANGSHHEGAFNL